MAFSFPTSPSVSDTVTLGGLVYIWNGSSWETQVVNLGLLSINNLSNVDFNSVTLDGSNGDGKVLAWDQALQVFAPIDQSGVSGLDTEIQFNNSGSLGSDSNLIFDSSQYAVVIGSGVTGRLEAATFIGHADQTTYLSSQTTGSESTHIALRSTSGVETNIYGFSTFYGSVRFEEQVQEKFSTINTATGTVTHDLDYGQVFRHTSPSSDFTANFVNINLTGDHAMTVTLVFEQGATAFITSAIQVGGAAQTINWQGGIVPSGTDNGVDIISFSIMNTGTTESPSYLVMGQLVDFN